MKVFLQIYHYFAQHRWLCWTLLTLLVALLALGALRLHYSEDIMAFLPFSEQQKHQFEVWQEQEKAQTITLIVEGESEDEMMDALDLFADFFYEETASCQALNGTALSVSTAVSVDQLARQTDSVSRQLPLLFTAADYARVDSLLTLDYIQSQLTLRHNQLLMPQTGVLQPILSHDPLNLFADFFSLSQPTSGAFDIVDGYIFSADHSRALAFIESPFGGNESGRNASLVDAVGRALKRTMHEMPAVSMRQIGSPVISVGNARQIKKDTAIALSVAVVLIALLLFFSLRRKRDIAYMLLAVAFGMLFGLGIMGLIVDEISLIVLGISSVMVGIAVNYPLHVIVHRDLREDMSTTLQEVLSPLLTGNITTVAAFLCLVPLQAKALRDLGLFSALMLIGTILFSIIFLPQMLEEKNTEQYRQVNNDDWLGKVASLQPRQNKYLLLALLLLTGVFGYFSTHLSFDSNLNHINYMTAEQRSDMDYFLQLAGKRNTQTVYLVNEIEKPAECAERWNQFWNAHRWQIDFFCQAAQESGFRLQAFQAFLSLTNGQVTLAAEPVTVIRKTEVDKNNIARQEEKLRELYPEMEVFDIQTLNASITDNLSGNFDYIGLVCSLIVLLFLCINLRSVWLGLIAFTPMLVAWVWILGAMYLLDIHFNIVNIILATFIFGQGDDYTIFITEGLVYEDHTHKPIMAAYKRSILLSALIMLVGIGVLVIARHPAMHSLGVVTVLGMFCVVLMAYLIPPVLYKAYKRLKKRA